MYVFVTLTEGGCRPRAFYCELRKKKLVDPDDPDSRNYKTSTLKAICGALARFFKDERGINIIKNETFLKPNDMFTAMTKVNKEQE